MVRRWLFVFVVTMPAGVLAQPTMPAPGSTPPAPPVEERVDVVAVTPLHGSGVPRLHLPANVQVLSGERLWPGSTDLAWTLAAGVGSLHVSEAQGGTFQPDLVFRGFGGSPLLGASEGLAVYLDGVRANEPFGDVLNWDALPPMSLESINVMPGSNPLFGLNALGGAISLRTRDGFTTTGTRLSALGGSFGRTRGEGDIGLYRGAWAGYLAASLLAENGWRDFSPSILRRGFGKASWRSAASRVEVSGVAAGNDMIGNGAAPVGLLDDDRAAVFTHPDRTDHDLTGVTLRADRFWSSTLRLEAMSYYRGTRLGTLNGDGDDDEEDDDEDELDEDDAPGEAEFDGVLNRSRTRSRATGAMVQLVSTRPLGRRTNHLVTGIAGDRASSRFAFSAELGTLLPNRGVSGGGVFEDDDAVGLRTRTGTIAIFVTDTLDLTPALHVTGGARIHWSTVRLRDQIGTSLNGDHAFRRLNPSVGATWDVSRRVNVFGGFNQSSRVPTPVELTCADPEDPCRLPNAFVADPPLDMPVASTWEGGLRGAAGRGSWSLALFDTRVDDDLIFVSSGPRRGQGHFENVTRTRRRGVEADATWRVARLSLSSSYTWQRATYADAFTVPSQFHPEAQDQELAVSPGDLLPGVPAHVARLSVLARMTSRLDVATSVRAQGSQVYRGDEANRLPRLGGFAVLDLQARHRLGRRATLVAQVNNLLNQEYATFGVLGSADLLGESYDDEARFVSPAPPRAAWIGVELAF